MNGYLLIVVFTGILAATLYWLQKRQAKIGVSEIKKEPEKKIEVIKAKEWVIEDEKEETVSVEPLPEPVEEPSPVIEKVEEPEPVEKTEPIEVQDITQLSGVGPKYRSLLREAGFNTVNQVASSEPQDLLEKLFEANERASITKRPPSLSIVEKWIELARSHQV